MNKKWALGIDVFVREMYTNTIIIKTKWAHFQIHQYLGHTFWLLEEGIREDLVRNPSCWLVKGEEGSQKGKIYWLR
jgi:hypothetical protein